LQLAAFTSTFDRFAVAPMLLTIAVGFGVPFAQVVAIASAYYLLYGLSQSVWGILSDRLGRVRVMRAALLGASIAGAFSALALNITALIALRAVAGACFGAIIPALLVYVGDTVPASTRHKVLADLMAAIAVGTALATAVGGLAAYGDAWRLAFAAPAVAAFILSLSMGRLPEPSGKPSPGALRRLAGIVRRPWPLLVVLLGFVEGAVIFGFLTFLAPALESRGYSSAVSGAVVGLYGLAVLAWTRSLKRFIDRLTPSRLIALGGAMLALGYGAAMADQGLIPVAATTILVGGAYAFMHTTLQAWATEVVPEARAPVVALFSAALFAGGAVATIGAAPLAESTAFGVLFAGAVIISLPLGIFGALARQRYARARGAGARDTGA
jgi:predicted MFS family arabinose efflux permease